MPTTRPLSALLAALALAGCASQPTAPAGVETSADPNCTKTREETITYGGHIRTRTVCTEWTFGPSRQQREDFDRRKGDAK